MYLSEWLFTHLNEPYTYQNESTAERKAGDAALGTYNILRVIVSHNSVDFVSYLVLILTCQQTKCQRKWSGASTKVLFGVFYLFVRRHLPCTTLGCFCKRSSQMLQTFCNISRLQSRCLWSYSFLTWTIRIGRSTLEFKSHMASCIVWIFVNNRFNHRRSICNSSFSI